MFRVGGKVLVTQDEARADKAGRRAGAPAESEQMKELIQALIESQDYVEIFGFYSRQYSISPL